MNIETTGGGVTLVLSIVLEYIHIYIYICIHKQGVGMASLGLAASNIEKAFITHIGGA